MQCGVSCIAPCEGRTFYDLRMVHDLRIGRLIRRRGTLVLECRFLCVECLPLSRYEGAGDIGGLGSTQ